MTEREKMVKIIADNSECFPDVGKCDECKYKNGEDSRSFCTTYKIADALIAAGFGDKSGYRLFISKDGTEIKQLYSCEEVEQIANERDEYKHRAEVAERALLTACANLIKDVEDNINMELLVHVVYTKFLRKAEKELAEEK